MVAQSYTTVTEIPGSGATAEQLAMLYTRYRLAGSLSQGKDVLEVACGTGLGLGYLRRHARMVVGGDYDAELLQYGRAHYGNSIGLLRLDAHALPFADRSFDVVILFEALYYLASPERFMGEARRVLRSEGVVVICTANRDWPGFNPSPFARRYFSAPDLYTMLASHGFAAQVCGGFPAESRTLLDHAMLGARRIAVGLHLIPPTMKGKEFLKRLVYGELQTIPNEVTDGMAEPSELMPLAKDMPTTAFKVLYVMGRVP